MGWFPLKAELASSLRSLFSIELEIDVSLSQFLLLITSGLKASLSVFEELWRLDDEASGLDVILVIALINPASKIERYWHKGYT